MKRLILLVAVAVLVLGALEATAGGNPRREKQRLTRADNALARSALVRRGDLGSGWTAFPVDVDSENDFQCKGFNPDFSAFTITGKAHAAFRTVRGESVVSFVEVYATRAQAIGDFRVGAKPAVARCLRQALEAQTQTNPSGLTFRVLSSRMVAAPKVGERSVAWRLVAHVSDGTTSVRLYLDVVGFQRGRSLAALMLTATERPLAGRLALSRTVAARMR